MNLAEKILNVRNFPAKKQTTATIKKATAEIETVELFEG